ncbi:MAG: DNA replication/repair protein RecF [Verrucomicrobia bacterium]|nr:DNA replication/repair protein RecF [Verrucomicrobiota bacterium]
MHLAELRLRDFRNYGRLDAQFPPGFHVFLGRNAQGKTNLLEAIYLLATLRSFRGAGGAQMVRHGSRGYFVGGSVVGRGVAEVKAYWSAKERQVSLNGAPVRRLSDYFGTLRAVVFCSEDVHLVKGVSRIRRRFLDLLLAQTRPEYLPLLLRYTQALRMRNALLKQSLPDEMQLAGFSDELVRLGESLMAARRALVPELSPRVSAAFARIAAGSDRLELEYHPSVRGDLAVALATSRSRERVMRTTVVGPHRDDLTLRVNDQPAGPYTSEGQKRTLALALKMAQTEWLTSVHGTPPVLLIDDVMGELDAVRRAGFLPLLHGSHRAGGQVFMTGTEETWPEALGKDLVRWTVDDGALRREA